MEITPSGAVVVRLRGRAAIVTILAGTVQTVISGCMLGFESPTGRSPVFLHVVGFFGVLLFGAVTLTTLYMALRPQAGLRIDSDGILDRSSWSAVGRIHWSEIAGFQAIVVGRMTFLSIVVLDPGLFSARGNLLQRFLRSKMAAITGTPVSIATVGLDADPDELMAAIHRFFDPGKVGRVSPSDNEALL